MSGALAFQRFYEVVVMEWVRGALPVKDVETWLEFCSRVNEGIDKSSLRKWPCGNEWRSLPPADLPR